MLSRTVLRAAGFLALTVLAACAGAPQVTRSLPIAGITEPVNLGALSRQFIAQTPYTVNFAFDIDALDARARADLDIQAAWILAHPAVRFSVYGHTDMVGSDAYNQELGMRRAQTVVAYLTGKGINPERLDAQISYGEAQPIIQTELRERANRRATTYV
ncbi:MAG: OmpA family protein, partial [Paracoccaceae bacterium]